MDDKELLERYEVMSEFDLMAVARKYDELSEAAQELLRHEFSRRSLEPPLIDEIDDALESRTLVTVRTFRDLPEAFIARSVLESAGIRCFLQDENTVRADWLWSNMIGGARLQVASEDEERAAEILAQPIPASFAVDSGADFEQPVCPKCGSLDVNVNDRDRKVAAASAVTLGYPFPWVVAVPAFLAQPSLYASHAWKCSNCGCLWQYEGDAEPEAFSPVN